MTDAGRHVPYLATAGLSFFRQNKSSTPPLRRLNWFRFRLA